MKASTRERKKRRRKRRDCDALTVRASQEGEQMGEEGGSWRFFCWYPGSVYSRHHDLKAVKRCSEASCREKVVPPPDAASSSSASSPSSLFCR
ncbi:hypothetical protein CesoFtcFv8_023916 [Champsocephalus esox]|uniref:Uncharacterized protein n=1 Tax=Champsocephalus esox TaxID=159716 RepID=A0AAN8B5M6_9TELE|nr:hypothetical protein CesoFtcFv8_023916 [Champsocephalus esox]